MESLYNRPTGGWMVSRRSCLLPFLLSASLLRAAAPGDLNFFKNYFVTGDYAVGGIGLQGTGVGGTASGNLTIAGVPANATIVAAWLYWQTAGNGPVINPPPGP